MRYLNDSARDTRRPLRVMGHSKGGNLAVYSSVKCRPEVRRRIIAVYNNDGPGLSERAMAEPGYARIERRIQTFLPQSSVVGILLGTAERYKVVHAEGTLGIVQHDPYAWQVRRGCFEYEPGLRRTSLLVDRTIRDWLGGMTPERRKEFVDAVYDVLHATNARTLDEIAAGMAAQFHGDHIRAGPARSRKAPSCPRRNRRTYIRLRAQQIRSRR